MFYVLESEKYGYDPSLRSILKKAQRFSNNLPLSFPIATTTYWACVLGIKNADYSKIAFP